jgi:hypothetical protein
LGFAGVVPEVTGRPSYHPAQLLKLYIYGYLNRIQSSRRLDREAQRNLEVIWLLQMLRPTIRPSPISARTTVPPSSSGRTTHHPAICYKSLWELPPQGPLHQGQEPRHMCLSNCTQRGYLSQYCQSACSYPDATTMLSTAQPVYQPNGTDYTCVSNCTASGYLYQYCHSACSY